MLKKIICVLNLKAVLCYCSCLLYTSVQTSDNDLDSVAPKELQVNAGRGKSGSHDESPVKTGDVVHAVNEHGRDATSDRRCLGSAGHSRPRAGFAIGGDNFHGGRRGRG